MIREKIGCHFTLSRLTSVHFAGKVKCEIGGLQGEIWRIGITVRGGASSPLGRCVPSFQSQVVKRGVMGTNKPKPPNAPTRKQMRFAANIVSGMSKAAA